MTNGHMIVGSTTHEALEKETITFCSQHTYTEVTVQFFPWNLSAFLLGSAWVDIIPGLYNFTDVHEILVVSPPRGGRYSFP